MYEIKSGLALDDMIAWPVSGFREGLKTTTNVDEGMVEEYPDDGDLSSDTDEGYQQDLSDETPEDSSMTDSYNMDENIDTGMVDENDMKPVVDGTEDGDSGADTGSTDTPAAE